MKSMRVEDDGVIAGEKQHLLARGLDLHVRGIE